MVGAIVLAAVGSGTAVGQSPEPFAFPDYSGRELTFVGHGGKSQENFANSFAAPFAAKTGLLLKQDSPSDLAKLRVQVESNNVTWDFVNIDAGFVMGNCGTLFEPITADMSTITPEFRYGDCVLPVGMTALRHDGARVAL
jgi:spermidine/putrescine-binding protein